MDCMTAYCIFERKKIRLATFTHALFKKSCYSKKRRSSPVIIKMKRRHTSAMLQRYKILYSFFLFSMQRRYGLGIEFIPVNTNEHNKITYQQRAKDKPEKSKHAQPYYHSKNSN